mmetsp:Transcript_12970/g.31629  ORF Transcript_12970/g.31629 Transcript_12970/m.31629 type:complete len:556 (-) Transcript_12970:188-1855(-)
MLGNSRIFVNRRGFEVERPRTGGNPLLNRRSPLVEEAERRTAEAIREIDEPVSTDDVVRTMQYFLQCLNETNYFLNFQAVGDAAANAWVPKFLQRWDLDRVLLSPKFRSRRNGVTLVTQVQEGWRSFYALQDGAHGSMGGPREVEWSLFSMDETSIRRVVPRTGIVAGEKKRGQQCGGRAWPAEYTELSCSVGCVICSNRAIPTVDPLLVVPGLTLAQQQVLRQVCPDAYLQSLDQYAISFWVTNKLLPVWHAWLATLPIPERRRQAAVLMWDKASIHTACADSGMQIGERMWVHVIPAEITGFVQPPDVGGLFRSLKSQLRREARTAPPGVESFADHAQRLCRLWALAKGFSTNYSTRKEFLQCGYADSHSGGNHHLHGRLRDFLIEKGCRDMVRPFIDPQRVVDWASRRRAYAANNPQPPEDSSTDEGETEMDSDSDAPDDDAPDGGAEPAAQKFRFKDEREMVLFKACIHKVRREAPKASRWSAREVFDRALALRRTLKAPWDALAEDEAAEQRENAFMALLRQEGQWQRAERDRRESRALQTLASSSNKEL